MRCPPGRRGVHRHCVRSESPDARRYRVPKENEGERDGRQGVGAPRSTCEPGEPIPRDPGEGRGRRIRMPREGTMTDTSRSDSMSPELQRIADMARDFPAPAGAARQRAVANA